MEGRRALATLTVAAFAVLAAAPGAATSQAAPARAGDAARAAALERHWRSTHPSATPKARAAQSASTLLARAQPDECWAPGQPYMPLSPGGSCPAGRQPKVNQAYVWGLAKADGALWFGTAPNTHCLVLAGFLGSTAPITTPTWTCEFGSSPFLAQINSTLPPTQQLPGAIGDWRPPQIFRYEEGSGRLVDVGATMPAPAQGMLSRMLGLRSAGAIGRVVFLAGPALGGGITMFAFETQTNELIAARHLPQYSNIRRWIVAGDELYTAVGKTGGGGALLRWDGDPAAPGTAGAPAASLFNFVEAGQMPTEGADLTAHEGRIFVTTWPQAFGGTIAGRAGLYMTTRLPGSGGLAASTDPLQQVWSIDDFEPDPVTAATVGGGALASFGGKLFWGTMHVPGLATIAHLRAYSGIYGGDPSTAQSLVAALGTWRAISVFRGSGLGTPGQRIELAYGDRFMPAFSESTGWRIAPNKLARGGARPLFGPSGFGDAFNNYTWAMATTPSGLFIGTMDWSYLARSALGSLGDLISRLRSRLGVGANGADLWRFASPDVRARAFSRDGLGNPLNYGIRTLEADGATLYAGTANPMNLATDPSGPLGGWELRRLGD
jgi:hypothetical protein